MLNCLYALCALVNMNRRTAILDSGCDN
uniref:Uncharacterized protein n=1 Tax=Rhizophora mucronata TaxID=61149 RepID=A0A2P2IKE1_RHIMU